MITVNELRVGNWVLCNGTKKVKSIYYNNTIGADDGYNYEIELCTAIPLTPEILEKAGFGWSIYHQAFHKEDFRFDLFECYPKGFEMQTFKGITSICRNILYLHQLQNLYFALTGKELEIIF